MANIRTTNKNHKNAVANGSRISKPAAPADKVATGAAVAPLAK